MRVDHAHLPRGALGTWLGLAAILALAGCTHVRPWERGDLARLEQHSARQAQQRSYRNHFWAVREAGGGGTGDPGGGCGCN